MRNHDGTSASEDSSQHGRHSLIKRCLEERLGLWHLADPAGAGIGPRVPSGTAAPRRAANQGDPLAAHDMGEVDPALHAGSAKLQGCHLAARLRIEFEAQLPGVPALWAALTESLPSGTASVSSDSAETQGDQMMMLLQERSPPSSLRPRGVRHSTVGEPTLPTAQAPTASSRFLAVGPHLLDPAQERGKRRGLRLWAGDGQGQKGWAKGEGRDLGQGNGSCRQSQTSRGSFLGPSTLPTSFPKNSGKKQALDSGGGAPCTRVPSYSPGHCPPHLA